MKKLLVLLAFLGLVACTYQIPCPETPMPQKTPDKAVLDAFEKGYRQAQSEQKQCDVCLKRLTLAELQAFLTEDQCNRCGDEATGCIDRAECLTKSARDKGYDCYGVIINSDTNSHALVAFPLTNGSLVFIEPLYDQQVQVKVGMNYRENFSGEYGTWIIRKIGIFP